MSFGRALRRLAHGVGAFLLTVATASAQSVISGAVRDSSGAALPGVTVDASSDVLIEKTRSVVTDDQGRYTVVDLRPGIYKVVFSLPGFTTLERSELELPANFTATIDAELSVGALEETVTVSGSSPIVDVQSSQTTINLRREVIDALPTSRTYAAEGALAVGVRVSSQNVGGARIASQQRLIVHGANAADNTIAVDGMPMMSFYSNGETQPNHNDAMTQEVVVQTVSPGAEVSGGGAFINLIPREGGNIFSGSGFVGYTGSSMQGSNLDDELRSQGLVSGDAVDQIYDVNFSFGGPIRKDNLWFFGSYRNIANANVVANSFYPDGSPALYDQDAQNYTVRLTWQAAPKHKFTAYIDRVFKMVHHQFNSGDEVTRASRVWPSPLYYTAATKWSSPMSSRLLLEAGYGVSFNGISMIYQPGVAKERGTPEWYANASRQDITLARRTVAGPAESWAYPPVYILTAAASYVTGSNTLKAGIVNRQGPYRTSANVNADLIQRYRNGVPDSVIVYNTPVRSKHEINADLGLYVQDSWTFKRLTLNPGVRFEYFNAGITEAQVEAGRFVPFRSYSAQHDLPNWFDVAPRLGAVYNLTGDAKTALRFGFNRYNVSYSNNATSPYDPLTLRSDTRNWADCDYLPGTSTCSGRALSTNGDNIAQDNEIGPVVTPFDQNRFADPNRQRDYNLQYNVGVDRQLLDRVSMSFAWFRRIWYDQTITRNELVDPVADFIPFQTTNPLTGESMTLYNLNPAKAGQARLVDFTTENPDKTSKSYSGMEMSFTARLPRGGTVVAGWLADRTTAKTCEQRDPNQLYNCDQSQFGMPYRHDFKFTGAYPIGLGVTVGAIFQSYAGNAAPIDWVVPASVFPNGRRTQAVTITISDPGTEYLDRWNQLDLSVRRQFAVGRFKIDGSLDMFNALNGNVVLTRNLQYGTSLGTPQSILQPRLFRVSSTMRF